MSNIGLDSEVITHCSLEEVVAMSKIPCKPPPLSLEKLRSIFDTRDTDTVDTFEKECNAYCEALDNEVSAKRKYLRLIYGLLLERDVLVWVAERMKEQGDSRPLEIFKHEDEQLRNLMNMVDEKEKLVRDRWGLFS
jgi:hypothetical protein